MGFPLTHAACGRRDGRIFGLITGAGRLLSLSLSTVPTRLRPRVTKFRRLFLLERLHFGRPRRSSPTPSPPLSLDALDLDGAEENDLDLECVVCCELYDTSVRAPMVLPCSGAHEICRTCVAALRKADGTIQCPKCREDATGAVNPNRGLIAALRLSRRS